MQQQCGPLGFQGLGSSRGAMGVVEVQPWRSGHPRIVGGDGRIVEVLVYERPLLEARIGEMCTDVGLWPGLAYNGPPRAGGPCERLGVEDGS